MDGNEKLGEFMDHNVKEFGQSGVLLTSLIRDLIEQEEYKKGIDLLYEGIVR